MRSHHLRAAAGGNSGGGWEILMVTQGKSNHSSGWNVFGNTGNSGFRTATASSTGASSRTAINQGSGLYDAFFNKTGITKIALADWHKGGTHGLDPTSDFNRYIVYDLVATTTKTMYDTILDLDTYNLNNSNWAGSPGDSMFGADSVDNFVAGNYESGNMSANSGHYSAVNNIGTPDKFVIWGINRDSDNDTQVLCAYGGNLQSGKSDSWRGSTPAQTFFSYWGNDWHSNSVDQTISRSSQTQPGFIGSGISSSDYIYLLAS